MIRHTTVRILALSLFLACATTAQAVDPPTPADPEKARIAELERAVAQLLKENEDLTAEVKRLSGAVYDLSTREGDRYVPKLFGNMNVSSSFRNEVMRTNQGQLVINNMMKKPVIYHINGARWKIPKGRHAVWVRLGVVNVHTSGEMPHALNDWRLAASKRHYQLKVSIRPIDSVPRGS
jgi:hypothetical protein